MHSTIPQRIFPFIALKGYFKTLNVMNCRLMFKIKSFMVPTIRQKFPSDKKFPSQLCPGCSSDTEAPSWVMSLASDVTSGEVGEVHGNLDTQAHVVQCTVYSDLRAVHSCC